MTAAKEDVLSSSFPQQKRLVKIPLRKAAFERPAALSVRTFGTRHSLDGRQSYGFHFITVIKALVKVLVMAAGAPILNTATPSLAIPRH